jgi:anti-sigma regulatory factor (Ser/Thr protein kinase)
VVAVAGGGVHTFRIRADIGSMGMVRSAMSSLMARERWPKETCDRLVLAGVEAITNAIEHGSVAEGSVEIEVLVDGGVARVRVVDGGRPGSRVPTFDVQPPPPTAVRGRGLVIMRHLADRAEAAPAGGGTEIVLEFRRERRLANGRRPAADLG